MWSRSFRSTPFTSKYFRNNSWFAGFSPARRRFRFNSPSFPGDACIKTLVRRKRSLQRRRPRFRPSDASHLGARTSHRLRFERAIRIAGIRQARVDIERPRNHHRAQQKKRPERQHDRGGAGPAVFCQARRNHHSGVRPRATTARRSARFGRWMTSSIRRGNVPLSVHRSTQALRRVSK